MKPKSHTLTSYSCPCCHWEARQLESKQCLTECIPPRQPSTPELPPHPFLKNSGVPLQSGHTCHRANTRAVSEDWGRVLECQPALLWAAARCSPGGASKRLMMRGYVELGAPRGAFLHVVAKPFNMCRPFNTFSPLSCTLPHGTRNSGCQARSFP